MKKEVWSYDHQDILRQLTKCMQRWWNCHCSVRRPSSREGLFGTASKGNSTESFSWSRSSDCHFLKLCLSSLQGGKGEQGSPGIYGSKGEKGDRVSRPFLKLHRIPVHFQAATCKGRIWGSKQIFSLICFSHFWATHLPQSGMLTYETWNIQLLQERAQGWERNESISKI